MAQDKSQKEECGQELHSSRSGPTGESPADLVHVEVNYERQSAGARANIHLIAEHGVQLLSGIVLEAQQDVAVPDTEDGLLEEHARLEIRNTLGLPACPLSTQRDGQG